MFLGPLPWVVFPRAVLLFSILLLGFSPEVLAQVQNAAPSDAKRVTVSQNNDGSRTTYEIDGETRKAVATTLSAEGKMQSRIRYDLDEAGRYLRGEVFGPRDDLRFKTSYKYDASGRLEEETQLTKEGAVKNRIVYSYDQLTGRQTGYAVYDAAGRRLGQTNASAANPPPPRPSATPAKRSR